MLQPFSPPARQLDRLRILAVVLLALDLGSLALTAWPGLMTSSTAQVARAISALASVALVLALWQLLRSLAAVREAQLADHERLREIVDALPAGIVVLDREDRVQLFNRDFSDLYSSLAQVEIGMPFETLVNAAADGGLIPQARGQERDWVAARMKIHRNPGVPILRQFADGRWRRIVEQRLCDGSVLAHSVDITELMHKEAALEAARRDADQARERLATAIEALPATFELYDADDRLVLYNQALVQAYPHMALHLGRGLRFEELARLNIAGGGRPDVVGREDAWLAMRRAQRRAPKPGHSELMPAGDGRWLRMYETRLGYGGMVVIRVDVTEFEVQRAALEQARAQAELARLRFEDAIAVLPAGFELYDASDHLLMTNGVMREMYPPIAELLDQQLTFEALVRANVARGGLHQGMPAEDFERWLATRLEQRRSGGPPREHRLTDGRWVRTYERRTREGGIVGVRIDVTELMQRDQALSALNDRLQALNDELAELSETDPLTGLANRRLFDRRLLEESSRADRQQMPLALLVLDVDHFKAYNDHYGHPAGDACLQQLAALLRELARRPSDLVARLGGEEFAVLLPHQDGAEALQLAHRCMALLEAAAIEHRGTPLAAHVSCSIGVADMQGLGQAGSAAALLAAADAAMYEAKRMGRRRVVRHGQP